MLQATLSLFATVLSAQLEEKPLSVPAAEPVLERGSPALFSWGDADGDARLDLAAVSAEGVLQLLANAGEGRFEDVTERSGLAGIDNAALALWLDYDADGRLDLFIGAKAGASRLFRNEGGLFVDMTAASGLASEGAVHYAHGLDHDGDGRLDLHVVTVERSELCSMVFRGLEGGFFERSELPLAGAGVAVRPGGLVLTDAAPETPSAPGPSSDEPGPGRRGSVPDAGGAKGSSASPAPLGQPPSIAGARVFPSPAFPLPGDCATSLQDQANPSTCVLASTSPTLGRLYPLSTNLFVAVGGNVGVGTTSPTARLEVAGTARMTGTLTLAPAGDTALDVSTGSIYKGGALFIHTKGGVNNTGLGRNALANVTTGYSNTASGDRALYSNTTGRNNTAGGYRALHYNTTGFRNSASGSLSLMGNTTGFHNTASGYCALRFNTTGFRNTASGVFALLRNTTGSYNTASGDSALFYNSTGSSNTASGYRALYSNTAGSGNTAAGGRALSDNTTGNYNTASGNSALFYNSTGNLNTASGYRALYSNTAGSGNTATGGRALSNNTTGFFNTAVGVYALYSSTVSSGNTAIGFRALRDGSGGGNTATGFEALFLCTTGSLNTASGLDALSRTTTGSGNTAMGNRALYVNSTASNNTACGNTALYSNTAGERNTALGYRAGRNLTTGSDNIAIGNEAVGGEAHTIRVGTGGTHTRTFLAGIRGVTTDVADAIPVLIDSAGQLGTVSSSRRFKEEIEDMGARTERLLQLRPVVFRYKPEFQSGERPLEYGLIAEEVAEVFPELVVHDEEGQPFTVKYHLLSAMLLNELKEQENQMKELHARLAALEGERAASRSRPETP